jgi:hypothetical protein
MYVAHNFGLLFSTVNNGSILTLNGFGHILGDFLQTHPVTLMSGKPL